MLKSNEEGGDEEMKPQFELERNTAVINFSAHYCNTEDELLNSLGFNEF